LQKTWLTLFNSHLAQPDPIMTWKILVCFTRFSRAKGRVAYYTWPNSLLYNPKISIKVNCDIPGVT